MPPAIDSSPARARRARGGRAARPRKCSRQRVRSATDDLGCRVHLDSDLVEDLSKSVELTKLFRTSLHFPQRGGAVRIFLISFLARAPPPPARQEMLAISILSTAWAPMLAPSRSAVHASRNPVIHVRMSTYPAPEGFAWSSVPELAPGPPPISTATVAVAGSPSDSSSWGPAPAAPAVVPAAAEKKPAAEKKRKPATKGIFAPLVTGAKALMGEEELNKLRGEVIAQHSKVISAFVDTSESPFGQLVIRKMFEAADKDGSGGVDKEELRAALKALGFDFLEEKQVSGILERADTSGDLVIDFEEFVKETPRCAHHRRNPHRLSRPPPRRDRPPFCVNRLTGCVVARFAP